jgi:hypothetical protein
MIFCEGASASGCASSTLAASVVEIEVGAGGGAVGVSSEARIREIGGSTVVFFFASPSAIFFSGCFLSISETLSTGARGGAAGFGAAAG